MYYTSHYLFNNKINYNNNIHEKDISDNNYRGTICWYINTQSLLAVISTICFKYNRNFFSIIYTINSIRYQYSSSLHMKDNYQY